MKSDHMALALQALGDFSLHIRKEGDWYASVRAEISSGGILRSPTVSEPSPQAAIVAMFQIYTKPGTRVVINAFRENRRNVTWNGFMWEDVP